MTVLTGYRSFARHEDYDVESHGKICVIRALRGRGVCDVNLSPPLPARPAGVTP